MIWPFSVNSQILHFMQICTAVVAELLFMYKWMDRKRAKI